jgi:hypothetical protein
MEGAMTSSFKKLMIAALVACGAAAIQPAPAEAQVYYGRHGYHGAYPGYAPRYRPVRAFHGPRYGWRGGYRRAYWGPRYGGYYRYGGYGYRGYPYGYYRRSDNGGAVVAGLIGGLALGAIANAATRPAYYRRAAYPAYNNCFFERRRIVTRTGRTVVRRVRTCY